MKNETRVQYAPGEWASEYCGKDTIKIFKASDKRRIATIKVKSMILDEANAQLIASAPELLEALEDCREFILRHDEQTAEELDFCSDISNLITKANGAI